MSHANANPRNDGSWIDSCGGIVAGNYHQAKTNNVPSFDWSSLNPSSELHWHECYPSLPPQQAAQHILSTPPRSRTFSCALLSLPLDYHNTTNPHNVTVPILKASSPPLSHHHGTIFTAFGGAGNSRIKDFMEMAFSGNYFLDAIDPDHEYDVLTFDNRGFSYSSPSARCFDALLNGKLWEERMSDLGGVMSTQDGDEGLWVRLASASAKGELCAERDARNGDIRRHMSTAYAARDMLEIFKLEHHSSQSSLLKSSMGDEPPKLKFLGRLYGTMVGQTFASLHSEHVSRMVLDGSVDGKDWTGKWQLQHLMNAEAVWNTLYEDCFEAEEACSLWRTADYGPGDITNRVTKFLEILEQRPSYTVSDGNARLITYRDVKIAMYWTTMAPAFGAPTIASILDALIKGHTNVTLSFPFEVGSISKYSNCPENDTPDSLAGSNMDAGTALNCADAEDITNNTIEDFKDYLSKLEAQSHIAAFFQGERKVRCMGWPFHIEARGRQLETGDANHYPGSVVLEQDARGHCALGNAMPSACLLGHVRKYLKNGDLPQPGTICGKDCNVFDGSCQGEGKQPGDS